MSQDRRLARLFIGGCVGVCGGFVEWFVEGECGSEGARVGWRKVSGLKKIPTIELCSYLTMPKEYQHCYN